MSSRIACHSKSDLPFFMCSVPKRSAGMPRRKYVAQVDNIYFLSRIGESLRWATSDITREALPEEVVLLLRRLDRLEARNLTRESRRCR